MTRRRQAALLAPLAVALILAVVIALVEPPHRTGVETLYEISPGTAERVAAGLPIDEVLPARLETSVGENLVVRNEDLTSHVFGPFVLAPGQEWSQRFAMDGEYSMVCSLYPNVDLVIAVDSASDPPRMAGHARDAWAAAWLLAAGLLAGGLALALAMDGSRWAVEAETLVLLSLVLLGGAFALVAMDALALSRVAPWRDVLASRALPLWMAGLAATTGLVLLTWLAESFPDYRTQAWLAGLGATVVTIAAGLWSIASYDAAGIALAVTGLALLVGATVWSVRVPAGDDPAHAVLRVLAVVGLGVLIAGLPWPVATPVWLAARGGLVLLLGLGLVWLGSRAIAAKPRSLAWLATGAGSVLAVVGVAQIFVAWLGYVEATATLGAAAVHAPPVLCRVVGARIAWLSELAF